VETFTGSPEGERQAEGKLTIVEYLIRTLVMYRSLNLGDYRPYCKALCCAVVELNICLQEFLRISLHLFLYISFLLALLVLYLYVFLVCSSAYE